jgi:hypothetical protein
MTALVAGIAARKYVPTPYAGTPRNAPNSRPQHRAQILSVQAHCDTILGRIFSDDGIIHPIIQSSISAGGGTYA